MQCLSIKREDILSAYADTANFTQGEAKDIVKQLNAVLDRLEAPGLQIRFVKEKTLKELLSWIKIAQEFVISIFDLNEEIKKTEDMEWRCVLRILLLNEVPLDLGDSREKGKHKSKKHIVGTCIRVNLKNVVKNGKTFCNLYRMNKDCISEWESFKKKFPFHNDDWCVEELLQKCEDCGVDVRKLAAVSELKQLLVNFYMMKIENCKTIAAEGMKKIRRISGRQILEMQVREGVVVLP